MLIIHKNKLQNHWITELHTKVDSDCSSREILLLALTKYRTKDSKGTYAPCWGNLLPLF